MSVLKFNSKPPGAASAKNVAYIARDSACDSLSFHNLDDLETGDRQSNKTNGIAYAEERMEQEEDKRGDRNHYRIIITFDRDVDTEEAKQLTHDYLEENFPNQAAIVAIHQDKQKDDADKEKIRDSKHTHAHVWMDCRDKKTGRKLNIEKEKFKTLDEKWLEKYDEKYGTDYQKEFTEKKRETEQWKKDYAFAKKHDLPLPEKPERVADNYYKNKKERFIEKDRAAVGVVYDKDRNDRSDSLTADGQRRIETSQQQLAGSERAINERANSGERAEQAAGAAVREADKLSKGVENIPERRTRNTNLTKDVQRAAEDAERNAPDTSRDFYDR